MQFVTEMPPSTWKCSPNAKTVKKIPDSMPGELKLNSSTVEDLLS